MEKPLCYASPGYQTGRMNLSLTGSGVGNRPGLEGDNHKSYEEDAPMFEIKRRLNLPLFAEGAPAGDGGGAGGEGSSAATGENPAAAGREWLRANGAPEAAITDGRAEAVGRELSSSSVSRCSSSAIATGDASISLEVFSFILH